MLLQANNLKSTERELKVLKVKLGDEGVLDKSLEAKLIEQQAKGNFIVLELFSVNLSIKLD